MTSLSHRGSCELRPLALTKRNYGSFLQRKSINSAHKGPLVEHKVSPSDTFLGIAIQYDASVDDIKRINGLVNHYDLWARKTLKIPSNTEFPPQLDDPAPVHGSPTREGPALVDHVTENRKLHRGESITKQEVRTTKMSDRSSSTENNGVQEFFKSFDSSATKNAELAKKTISRLA